MRLSVLCFLLCCSSLLCAEDWTLGASAFSVESRSASSAEQKAAVDLPRLLLEKIGKDAEHILSGQELLEHELYELQTKRLSLFLQLSREIRLRDSLVLSEKKPNKLKKKLAAEEEKILEIEEKIKANLAEAEQKKAGVPETAESHSSLTQSIVLYQGDEMSLYEEAEEIIRTQDIVSKKINGLISGSLVTYGDYAAVTAELTLYPGATPAGTEQVPSWRRLIWCSWITSRIFRMASYSGSILDAFFSSSLKKAFLVVSRAFFVADMMEVSSLIPAGENLMPCACMSFMTYAIFTQ